MSALMHAVRIHVEDDGYQESISWFVDHGLTWSRPGRPKSALRVVRALLEEYRVPSRKEFFEFRRAVGIAFRCVRMLIEELKRGLAAVEGGVLVEARCKRVFDASLTLKEWRKVVEILRQATTTAPMGLPLLSDPKCPGRPPAWAGCLLVAIRDAFNGTLPKGANPDQLGAVVGACNRASQAWVLARAHPVEGANLALSKIIEERRRRSRAAKTASVREEKRLKEHPLERTTIVLGNRRRRKPRSS